MWKRLGFVAFLSAGLMVLTSLPYFGCGNPNRNNLTNGNSSNQNSTNSEQPVGEQPLGEQPAQEQTVNPDGGAAE